jgi:amidohydrolase
MDVSTHEIKELAGRFSNEMIGIRRYLHQHPELSTEEHNTAAFIALRLGEWGIPCKTGIGGTGVVGMIVGGRAVGPVVALRADMDALPIGEENEVPFRSVNPGVMHACGHDVHMACLLGAARILNQLKDRLQGGVKLIFQPSEERYPGGAIAMIRDGVLENPRPDWIIGQHVYPELDAGMAGMRAGYYMAATDEIYLTVLGKGGHAATPHKVIDPILIASHIVIALQQIVSRHALPTQPTVISFGRLIADGRTNIIPDKARLEGIMRTFDETWRTEVKEKINRFARDTARAMGGDCEVKIDQGYPALYNDPELTGKVWLAAQEYLGPENVKEMDMRMTAEDFSYYAREIPGCFIRLGVRNEGKGITSNLHTSTFNADEISIETGMGLLAQIAVKKLSGGL